MCRRAVLGEHSRRAGVRCVQCNGVSCVRPSCVLGLAPGMIVVLNVMDECRECNGSLLSAMNDHSSYTRISDVCLHSQHKAVTPVYNQGQV